MSSISVYLCHRNRLLTDCLAAILCQNKGFKCTVLDPAVPTTSIARLMPAESPDVLLLDPTLPAEQVALVSQQFRARFPQSRLILMVSSLATDRMIEFAQLQCHGYVLEEVSLKEVRDAIDTVLEGRQFCSPQLANALLVHLGRIDPQQGLLQFLDDVRITSREREILQLIALERLSNKQIARRLHVSLYTVKNHIHNVIEKLGVEDRYEAVQFAQRRKWLVGASAEVIS
jgi:DNA-binding NarL/FixJ family response regulator